MGPELTGAAQQRAQPLGGVLAAELCASGRSSGVSADTLT